MTPVLLGNPTLTRLKAWRYRVAGYHHTVRLDSLSEEWKALKATASALRDKTVLPICQSLLHAAKPTSQNPASCRFDMT